VKAKQSGLFIRSITTNLSFAEQLHRLLWALILRMNINFQLNNQLRDYVTYRNTTLKIILFYTVVANKILIIITIRQVVINIWRPLNKLYYFSKFRACVIDYLFHIYIYILTLLKYFSEIQLTRFKSSDL